MKHLELFESFYSTTYGKSDALLELETNISDILNDINIDGIEWVGFSQEAGSFGITNIDVNIFRPDGDNHKPFKFTEIKDTVSHLYSHLSELGFKLKGLSIVNEMNKKSMDFSNNTFRGIEHKDLLSIFNSDGQVNYGNKDAGTYKPKDILILKFSFNK
jgi:hypothetical protein